VLATCYRKLEEYDAAIKYYKEMIERYPEGRFAERAAYWVGILYMDEKKDYAQAGYWFEEQRRLYPESDFSRPALYFTGEVYHFRLKDYVRGAEAYEQYLAEYPRGPDIWSCYGGLSECYAKLGEFEQALAVLEAGYERAGTESLQREFLDRIEQVRQDSEGGGE
jgi:TolA-binding protein